ncbi:MAG: FeoB-associated Cys-rich membrane protein [Clostridiales bacterium]|nr:FeoB-associated Cys-rich membrane protein [Clostridiales bacterium]
MENIVAIVALVVVLGIAVLYIYKARKSGQKCVGCPYSKTCSAQQKAACGHAGENEN